MKRSAIGGSSGAMCLLSLHWNLRSTVSFWVSGPISRSLGTTRHVERADINIVGEVRSDANPDDLVPWAQYAQVLQPPIVTEAILQKILDKHGAEVNTKKSKFTAEYSTHEGIRDLVEQAWKNATPQDIAASYEGRKVVGAAIYDMDTDTGLKIPHIVGISGTKFKTPSVPTNTYVVIIDANNFVISCYPVNPADSVNPRED